MANILTKEIATSLLEKLTPAAERAGKGYDVSGETEIDMEAGYLSVTFYFTDMDLYDALNKSKNGILRKYRAGKLNEEEEAAAPAKRTSKATKTTAKSTKVAPRGKKAEEPEENPELEDAQALADAINEYIEDESGQLTGEEILKAAETGKYVAVNKKAANVFDADDLKQIKADKHNVLAYAIYSLELETEIEALAELVEAVAEAENEDGEAENGDDDWNEDDETEQVEVAPRRSRRVAK